MSRIRLIAASDDYLLEDRLTAAVAEISGELGGVEPDVQSAEASPESVATELVSPSLFAAERLIVVPDARDWLDAAPPPGLKIERTSEPDTRPLLEVLAAGIPEGMALVIGAWCGRKPTGPLVEAIQQVGTFQWIPLPARPKPWEDAVLSDEQAKVLEDVLRRAAGGTAFSPSAIRLLLERLGFAPRLLVQEVRKLSGAAGGSEVDDELVRRLTFPRERSLEVVRDAVLERRLQPLLDLVAAAEAGAPINDWQGQRIEVGALGPMLFAQVTNLQLQLLYLRCVAVAAGLESEMAPEQTANDGWYAKHFKTRIASGLLDRLVEDAPSPVVRPGGKPPTPFSLAAMFAGAGRYSDAELADAIAGVSRVEIGLRREAVVLATLTAWLAGFVAGEPR